ncbi:MAG: FAD-dependent oxidoreductase [Eubacteriales bacterium]
MDYDVIVIGAGLSGLSAASLLAKRGLKVIVVEQSFKPGGSCGTFKRQGAMFDTGAAMLFGFGDKGFNVHRFLYNVLEEPINVIKHDLLFSIYYKGNKIEFFSDIDKLIKELTKAFPKEEDNIRRFYSDMLKIYDKVVAKKPVFTTPDQVSKISKTFKLIKHPISYTKLLSFMNLSTKDLLNRYFANPDILNLFNKLTLLFYHTTIEELPAALVVMFIGNQAEGSYYPARSTVFLSGILEKAIEENDGEILYNRRVNKIIIEENKAKGVKLNTGKILNSDNIIYSGTIWNLYEKLIDDSLIAPDKKKRVLNMKGTNSSAILYALVKKEVIPKDTTPITLFTEDGSKIDENEITVYIPSIDDKTLCDEKHHIIMAIAPTFRKWPAYLKGYHSSATYKTMKGEEKDRLMKMLEIRYPGFIDGTVFSELSTPLTMEHYTLKNNGSIAGPTQSIGQHMLKRLHTKSEFNGLYCCGESTVMGTGASSVTVSGVAAANAILKEKKLSEFKNSKKFENYVRECKPPFLNNVKGEGKSPEKALQLKAKNCQYCEEPYCMNECPLDIRGINRKITVGNFLGAYKIVYDSRYTKRELLNAKEHCILNQDDKILVDITDIVDGLKNLYKGEV